MNDTKGIAVIVLSVTCVVLFVAFISLAFGLQKQKTSIQDEIAKRINAEERLQEVASENSAITGEIEKLRAEVSETKNSLEQEKLTVEALQNELQKEKLLSQKLQDDLKEKLAAGQSQ